MKNVNFIQDLNAVQIDLENGDNTILLSQNRKEIARVDKNKKGKFDFTVYSLEDPTKPSMFIKDINKMSLMNISLNIIPKYLLNYFLDTVKRM